MGEAVVEQAKGALMLHYRIGSYEALAVLARWAHDAGVSLRDMSTAVTHGVCQGRILGYGDDPRLVRWVHGRLDEHVINEETLLRAGEPVVPWRAQGWESNGPHPWASSQVSGDQP